MIKGRHDGRCRQAGDTCRRREVRRSLHVFGHRPRRAERQDGQHPGRRHLPQLLGRRALHHLAQGAHDQRVRLRLRLLCEPCEQRGAARRLQAPRTGRPHHRVLPAQLHGRAVPQLRRHPQPRLHHRAHGPDPVHPAPRIRLPRLHPREGRARHLACAHRPAGASGRPHEREHGASLAEEPGAAGSRQEQAAHPGAHAPDQGEHRRGQGHARPHAQGDHVHDPGAPQEEGARVRASRAEHRR